MELEGKRLAYAAEQDRLGPMRCGSRGCIFAIGAILVLLPESKIDRLFTCADPQGKIDFLVFEITLLLDGSRMDLNSITAVARPRQRAQIEPFEAGDAWLGGGTWLFSEPQPELRRLIDLAGLGWRSLELSAAGLNIAATCTIAELAAFEEPDFAAWPLIRQCCRSLLGSFKVWNVATVGGNLCMALPAGPMIALTAALDGICTIWQADGGNRTVPVVDFVLGPQQTPLQPGDILRQIDIPAAALARRAAFRRISLSPLGRTGALLIGTRDSRSGAFALTVTGSVPRPIRLTFAGVPAAATLLQRLDRAIPAPLYYDDVHGTPDWRRHVTTHFAEEIRQELSDGGRA
jgi:CO/xanthine dehydrogenase FAD-binding subunit